VLSEGDVIDLGRDFKMKVLHTPGHSKGSISLLLEKDRALFTGDAVPRKGDMPVYEDVGELVRSIRRLKRIKGIEAVFSSWDEPRTGKEAPQIMDESLEYLREIHEMVLKFHEQQGPMEPMELCKVIVAKLGLPEIALNPMVAKSLESHLHTVNSETVFR
jgi:glyoxylase-like metal-dependent hydrolase (beta-lactamase superfamily II)